MKITNVIARSIAKIASIAAREAFGTASWYGSYQPKEPATLEDFVKKRDKKKR